MPWDLTIRSVTGDLGSLDKVQAAISHVFPSVRFGCAPSGMEKIRAAAERGIEFPDVIRDFMVSQPARHIGELETDGISLQFQLGPVDLVQEVGVEVRGTGDPFPLLRQLIAVDGWQVFDDATRKMLTANSESRGTGWEKLQTMLADVNRND